MKKKISVKILSAFLSLLMVMSILPVGAITAQAAGYIFPVIGTTKISSGFKTSSRPTHYGIDIPGARLTVVASRPGRVIYVYNKCPHWNSSAAGCEKEHNNNYGNLIKIQHSDGSVAFYGHLLKDTIKVSYGQEVSAGQELAQTGSSGMSTGAHLHFEIRSAGHLKSSDRKNYNIDVNPSNIGYTYLQQPISGVVGPNEDEKHSPANSGHYDAGVKKATGTYKNTCNSGVNMRSSAGVKVGNKIGCTVPKNAEVYVYETNGNWGKITFAGKVGWVCLDYFTKVNIPVPATPSISNISSENIAKGKTITFSWNAVSGATGYTVGIRSSSINQDIDVGNTTSYTFVLSNAEKYDFYIKASNVSGSSNWSSARSCTAHEPVTISFVDWDNTPLGSQTVDYGASATAPSAPQRKGYTFQGWTDSFYNVTADKTIKATYKINTYTVNFFDREGTLIDSQKVNYGSDATPPTNTNENSKYKFLGWNSMDYINVYTDRTDKNINIDGIYSWYNYDLPTICTIKSATRQYDGYYVTFDIENNDSKPTTGRAVVALKTAEGKLVDMTESTAFSIPAGKTKSGVEVFIPCNKVASSIEVFMVSDYSSGVPISPSVNTTIKEGLMYAESTVKPDNSDGTLDIQEVTQYSYRDKEFSTGNTKTKEGWTYTGNRTEQEGGWSGWGWNFIGGYENESQRREVETQTALTGNYNQKLVYHFYHCHLSNGNVTPTWNSNTVHYANLDYDLGRVGTSSVGNTPMYGYYKDGSCKNVWYRRGDYQWYEPDYNSPIYGTQYRYRDINYIYNFYRWKTWSEWSDTEVTANGNRDVNTRTVYRYKSNAVQPEDNSGKLRTVNGKLDTSFAGKQITLYVYGYTGASDYTNQYIGQSTVANDGSYSFTFKLREEPTVKTGDFTVAIGIEGTTDRTVIDTIEAPKPTYTVKFYDWDGTVISTQAVTEGESAVLPENPTKDGYNFLGWDKSVSNIKEDTEFYADFEKKQYTVVFVDWENQQIEIKKFNHGDVLVAPEAETVEGYAFKGWDSENTIVTQDMVVTAQYEANEYTVKFYDWNNNVIDTQTVKHGETAVVPDDPEEEGVNFADWFNPEDYQYVKHDAIIYPSYYFDETADTPVANYTTGEYNDKIQLMLTSNDPNAVIYYFLNGDEITEQIYTGPIEIDKSCSVTYYATSLGKNDSEVSTEYYCINTGDKPSEWMLYSEIPDDVKNNLDDYVLESEAGYKYKDVQKTSNSDEINNLRDSGWTLNKTSYTEYTNWQDEEIVVDNSLIGFEVDTQETDDTSVKWYQYSHYKYTDSNGDVQYSPTAIDGYSCEYETVTLENRLSIAGFTDDNISYYNHNNQRWFNQSRVNGLKTQYRSRYQVAEYYKWTDWTTDAPTSNEKREYTSDDVYRYSNKNYHIVYINIYGDVLLVEEGKTIDTTQLDNIEGYNFVGLYTDEELTNKFDLSTPVTESLTLFTKYSPKEYTVIFQMQDGTELDAQSVEYMQAAKAPETDIVPGYVFGGWDKDFDCITEDTVITGKYFKESEYARISLDKTNVDMYQGNTVTLVPTVTPSNLVGEKIEWTSSEPSIVSVDDNGKITALSAGTATITVQVVRTKETASCNVTVSPDKSNFIILKSDSTLNYDSLGYLRRITIKTSVEKASKEFANDNLHYFNIAGTELGATDYIGTGTQIKLFNGENAVDMKTIVVTGDMTGDGVINNRDVAMMNKKLVGKVEVHECQNLAVDVNGDGYVDNKDAAMVARYLVGKETF